MTIYQFRILYIDTDQIPRDTVKQYLEQDGNVAVDITDNPDDALIRISTVPCHAVIADHTLPQMDGISLLKRVRETGNPVPFILFTSTRDVNTIIDALNNGADFCQEGR